MCRAVIRDSVFQWWTQVASFDFVGDLEFRFQVRRLNHCFFNMGQPGLFLFIFHGKAFCNWTFKRNISASVSSCVCFPGLSQKTGWSPGQVSPCLFVIYGEVFNLSIDLTVPGSNPGQLRRTERRNYGSFYAAFFFPSPATILRRLPSTQLWKNRNIGETSKERKTKMFFKQPLILRSCFRLDPFYYMTQVPCGTFTDIPETLQ